MPTVAWLGHDFSVHQHGDNWREVAGLYIFARLHEGNWYPEYIGKAANFRTYLPTHRHWQEAVQRGATHVHAMVLPDEAERDRIEAELIQHYQPPMNVQLRNPGG